MKTIKNFEKFSNEDYQKIDESWRQVKGWLKLPQVLIEMLLQKIIKFVPRIGLKYDQLAAKIDLGKSLSPYEIKDDLKKLTLNDIKNDNLRKTLKTTGIFDKWNVYYAHTTDPDQKFNINDSGRDVIYITKDELKKGDTYYGERISEHDIDKKYLKTTKRLLRDKGVEKFSDLEPQMYVVVAKHSEEHEEIKKERNVRYEKNIQKELEKLVNKCIKRDDFTGRSSQIRGYWDYNPVVFKVIQEDRVDLMKKLIDACEDLDGKEGVEEMLWQLVDNEGWQVRGGLKYLGNPEYKLPVHFVKSIEMANLFVPYMDIVKDNNWQRQIKDETIKKWFQQHITI